MQEILDFCSRVVPNEDEEQRRSAAHAQMLSACRAAKLFNLQSFGSRASGLELWDSDIDLVVLGLVQPSGENHSEALWYLPSTLLSSAHNDAQKPVLG